MLAWLLAHAQAIGRAGHDRSTLPQIERAQVELELSELSGLVIPVDDAIEIMGADCDLIRKALRSVPAHLI